eukprot:4663423-Pleurochrysis_carterae.AAC.5
MSNAAWRRIISTCRVTLATERRQLAAAASASNALLCRRDRATVAGADASECKRTRTADSVATRAFQQQNERCLTTS